MKNKINSRTMVTIAMLSAIASVLMFFEFPLPFVPSFYKIDLSDLPAIIGGFAYGPIAGTIIELIKVLIHLVVKGSSTGGVGELGNFFVGICYVVPASIIYKRHKTKKNALIGVIVGTLVMAIAGGFMNAYVLLPLYAKMFGTMDAIISLAHSVNSSINSVWQLILFAVMPFNIIKGVIVSLLTFILYKRLRNVVLK